MQNNMASNIHILGALTAVWFVSQSHSVENTLQWATIVARYTAYLLTARGLQEACMLAYKAITTRQYSFLQKLHEENKLSWMTYAVASATLMMTQQKLYAEDFPLLLAAFLFCQYLQTEQKPQPTINYGTGMACSFFEGYLKHVIPSAGQNDGFVDKIRKWESSEKSNHHKKKIVEHSFITNGNPRSRIKEELGQLAATKNVPHKSMEIQEKIEDLSYIPNDCQHYGINNGVGEIPATKSSIPLSLFMAMFYFEDSLRHVLESNGTDNSFMQKVRNWESSERVVFPVKRLLLVITKSLHCPPDLSEFNHPNRHDWPQLEPCVYKSLEEVKKDVAGVKNRRYSNTTYVIRWEDNSHPSVYLAAECATPLHTLYGVLQNHQLYRELVNVNKDELVQDFVTQLRNILDRSPDCRDKCELVFFDDSKNSNQYLPNVLLQKIQEIEPRYREVIEHNDRQQQDEEEVPLDAPPRVLEPNLVL